MPRQAYQLGDHNSLCSHCGRGYKFSQLREEWDGQMACFRCYNPKHPDLEPIVASREDSAIDPRSIPRASFDNLAFVDVEGLSVLGGVMFNGVDFGEEWTCDEMNISCDEGVDSIQDFEEIR